RRGAGALRPPALHPPGGGGERVGAGAAVGGFGAPVVLLADLGKASAAGPALQQAGQQIGGTARLLGTDRQAASVHQIAALFLPLLDAGPEIVADDAQVRDRLDDPALFRVWPGGPGGGGWGAGCGRP